MADDYDSDSILERVKRHYKEAREHQAAWRTEAKTDYDFYAGEQWAPEDLQALQDQMRPAIVFNRTAPVVDAIVGFEINNRQETRFIPRTQGDVQANEILTAAAEWVNDESDADTEDSTAFRDATICGMGWTETRLSDEGNPDMDVVIERVDPLEMFWDPTARKPNLADARWIGREKFLTKSEFLAQWPHGNVSPEDIKGWEDSLEDSTPGVSHRFGYQEDGSNERPQQALIRVWQYQWREKSTAYQALNPVTGQTEEIDEATLKEAKKTFPDLQYSKFRKTRVMQAFVAGGEVLEQGECPDPERFTLTCITGKYDRNRNLWYGVVRALRDPQEWANKWLSQSMHVLNTQAKGGVVAEKSAVSDVHEFEASWASTEAVTWVNEGALKNGAIQPKPMAQFPAGIDRLLQLAQQAFGEVTGVNAEMMGMADRQQAGVLEYQRKQAAVTILAPLFDSLRRYRKQRGRVLLHFITTYISDGRLIRIVGKESGQEQYIPLLKQPDTLKYDVIVDQSATSPNEKERTFSILTQMMPFLKDALPPTLIPELLKYSPLPDSLVQTFQQAAQKPDPMAEEMKKTQLRQENAKAAKDEADAQSKMMQGQQAQFESQARMTELQMQVKLKEMDLLAKREEMAFEREKWGFEIQRLEVQARNMAAQSAMRQQEAMNAPPVAHA